MMRLPRFRYLAPDDPKEIARVLAGEGSAASILAGGTDLFPNMKRRQQTPATVVSLRNAVALHETKNGSGMTLGSAVTLTDLVEDARIREHYPALHRAVAQIATPHLRNTATIGGNVCLDTRCNYYDQNYEWRKSIDFCLKKDGETCWVAPSSPKCLAVSSTDAAPALMALGAEVALLSTEGERRIPLSDLYTNDGQFYLTKRPEELLTSIHLPDQAGWRSTYWKLRRRDSIDFPILGTAIALRMSGDTAEDVRIVLGAVASRPLAVPEAEAALKGRQLTDDAIDEAARIATRLAKPVDNTDLHLAWRKSVVKTYVTGALRQLRGDDPATFGLLARRAALAGVGMAQP